MAGIVDEKKKNLYDVTVADNNAINADSNLYDLPDFTQDEYPALYAENNIEKNALQKDAFVNLYSTDGKQEHASAIKSANLYAETSKPTYGVAASRLAQSGLTGSGYSAFVGKQVQDAQQSAIDYADESLKQLGIQNDQQYKAYVDSNKDAFQLYRTLVSDGSTADEAAIALKDKGYDAHTVSIMPGVFDTWAKHTNEQSLSSSLGTVKGIGDIYSNESIDQAIQSGQISPEVGNWYKQNATVKRETAVTNALQNADNARAFLKAYNPEIFTDAKIGEMDEGAFAENVLLVADAMYESGDMSREKYKELYIDDIKNDIESLSGVDKTKRIIEIAGELYTNDPAVGKSNIRNDEIEFLKNSSNGYIEEITLKTYNSEKSRRTGHDVYNSAIERYFVMDGQRISFRAITSEQRDGLNMLNLETKKSIHYIGAKRTKN